jgi:hypothetical protein
MSSDFDGENINFLWRFVARLMLVCFKQTASRNLPRFLVANFTYLYDDGKRRLKCRAFFALGQFLSPLVAKQASPTRDNGVSEWRKPHVLAGTTERSLG